jgi:hypothetical protein
VTFNVTAGDATFAGGGTGRVVTTDGNGRAPVALRPGGSGTITVEAKRDLNGNGSIESYERTQFAVTATDGSNDDGGAEEINPSGDGDVVLVDGVVNDDGDIEVDFDNRAGAERTITDARVSFYYRSSPGSSGGNPGNGGGSPGQAKQSPPDSLSFRGTTFEIPGQLEPLDDPKPLPAGDPDDPDLTLITIDGNAKAEDFLILTLKFEETGETSTYFITLQG